MFPEGQNFSKMEICFPALASSLGVPSSLVFFSTLFSRWSTRIGGNARAGSIFRLALRGVRSVGSKTSPSGLPFVVFSAVISILVGCDFEDPSSPVCEFGRSRDSKNSAPSESDVLGWNFTGLFESCWLSFEWLCKCPDAEFFSVSSHDAQMTPHRLSQNSYTRGFTHAQPQRKGSLTASDI
uniref:Uncharacterized protein n=1 Tax=Rhodosorus marinus TaxID=101924 RepID=A0A7S3AA86_9RHOD